MKLSLYHLLLVVAFIGVVIWVFRRKRKTRFEKESRIPLEDGKDKKD